jgi:type II secretory pathway predicted ATPase ExeA
VRLRLEYNERRFFLILLNIDRALSGLEMRLFMKTKQLLCVMALSLISSAVMAGKPSSFKNAVDTTLPNGDSAKTKIVVCNNKAEFSMLEISNKWCTDAESTYCSKNKMKIAKKLCK